MQFRSGELYNERRGGATDVIGRDAWNGSPPRFCIISNSSDRVGQHVQFFSNF